MWILGLKRDNVGFASNTVKPPLILWPPPVYNGHHLFGRLSIH